MKFCQHHNVIDCHSYVAEYISLAMLTIVITTLLSSNDLLTAFFCSTAFTWDGLFNRQMEESVFLSVIDRGRVWLKVSPKRSFHSTGMILLISVQLRDGYHCLDL